MNGACNGEFILVLPPGALGRGQKVKYRLISIKKSISKIFIPNLCVYSQIKDPKHIRWDFHFVAWVMSQGWGGLWGDVGAEVVKDLFFQTWSCGISNRRG